MIDWLYSLIYERKDAEILKLSDLLGDKQALNDKLIEENISLIKRVETLRTDLSKYEGEYTVTNVIGLYSGEEIRATQKDKPSAHSSLTKTQALTIKSLFPEPQYKLFTVQNTNSMEPFIDANSIVICEKLTSRVKGLQPIVPGDICIYTYSNMNIIHRVKEVDNNLYFFKGDNNFFPDGWVKEEHIPYRYVGQLQTQQLITGD